MPIPRWMRGLRLVARAEQTIRAETLISHILKISAALAIIIVGVSGAASFLTTNISGLSTSDIVVPRYYVVILGSLLGLSIISLLVLGTTIAGLKHRLKSFELVSKQFSELEGHHYECDKHLFDRLFSDVIAGDIAPIGPIESSAQAIKYDILMTLDYGVRIFESYTREDCAISIMRVSIESGTPVFRTELRRGFKSAERGIMDFETIKTIGDNTATS